MRSVFDSLQYTDKDIIWYLHQVGDKFLSSECPDRSKKSLQFELYNALPVPSENIHPEQIIEMKSRYADDYSAFHVYLDELYKDVAYAPDEPVFQKMAYERFRAKLKDINKISEIKKDWFFRRYNLKFAMPVSMDLANVVIGAAMAAADIDNPLTTGLGLLQTSLAFIKIQNKVDDLINSSNESSNLVFLAKACDEGVI